MCFNLSLLEGGWEILRSNYKAARLNAGGDALQKAMRVVETAMTSLSIL